MDPQTFPGLPDQAAVYLGLLGTRWTIEQDGVVVQWRGQERRLVRFSEISAVEVRPLNALTRGSIRLRVPGVAPKQSAADDLAVLNRGMPLRFGPVNDELAAFADRIERRLARPGVDLRKVR